MTTLAKKLTAKTIMGNIKEIMRSEHVTGKKDGDVIPLFTIIGQVIGHTTGESDYGPWIKLKGRFRAENLLTGEVSSSAAAMLPDEATDPLLAVLAIDGASSVDMAFEVGLQLDDSAATGYTYNVRPLIAPSEDDPLERLAAQVAGTDRQLEAPKDEKKTAAK